MLEMSLVLGCFVGWLVGRSERERVCVGFESYHLMQVAYHSQRTGIIAIWRKFGCLRAMLLALCDRRYGAGGLMLHLIQLEDICV